MCEDKNIKSFILKSINQHGDKYDYSLVQYINARTKVKIICPEHGMFEQTPYLHYTGKGCPKCSGYIKHTNETIIKKFKEVHDNKYDYSLVDYKNNKTKVKIICPEHGVFQQSPSNHYSGNGCPKCENKGKNFYDFLRESNLSHNNKYNHYPKDFINYQTKINISCPLHGDFTQLPRHHISGVGCPKCYGNVKHTNETIIKKFKEVHGDKYDYSLVDYKNNKTKIKIICTEHGEFEQSPSHHLNYRGCPICKESRGEEKIRLYLTEKNIKFIREYRFNDCKYKRPLPFDFYLPEHSMCIEYNGVQHYKSVNYFGGDDKLKTQKEKDKIKELYCKNNDITLLLIKYDEDITNVLSSIF